MCVTSLTDLEAESTRIGNNTFLNNIIKLKRSENKWKSPKIYKK